VCIQGFEIPSILTERNPHHDITDIVSKTQHRTCPWARQSEHFALRIVTHCPWAKLGQTKFNDRQKEPFERQGSNGHLINDMEPYLLRDVSRSSPDRGENDKAGHAASSWWHKLLDGGFFCCTSGHVNSLVESPSLESGNKRKIGRDNRIFVLEKLETPVGKKKTKARR
jgi:hypothetical protein